MSDGKWYTEHVNITNTECLCDKKIENMLHQITELFDQRISKLEAHIMDLKTKLVEQEIREQNMLIRKHVPVAFIPSHTTSFSEIRSNIMSKKKPEKH